MEFNDYDPLNSKDFENLIADLYNIKEATNTYIIYGRHGQKQYGIDIYSTETKTGIQCKFKNGNQQRKTVKAIIIKELEEEFISFYNSDIPFEHFILASNFPHDTEIQNVAIKLSKKYGKSVSYIGKEVIKNDLVKYPVVANKYFGRFSISRDPISLVSYDIDETLCDWVKENGRNNSYRRSYNENINPFPVFDFRFINNTDSTIILNEIYVHIEYIPSISGMPQTGILSSIIQYKLKIDTGKKINKFRFIDPIYAEAKKPFRFHTELLELLDREEIYGTFSSGYFIKFIFKFNNNIQIKTPELSI